MSSFIRCSSHRLFKIKFLSENDNILFFTKLEIKVLFTSTGQLLNSFRYGFYLIGFSHFKCGMSLHDWLASEPELMIGSEVFKHIYRSNYLESLINTDGVVSEEISSRIHKGRLTIAKVRHFQCRRDICLSSKE